jgi:hypothetical protein
MDGGEVEALLVALALAAADDCYLVTSVGIDEIACDFSASTTDALRYGAEDSPEARKKRAEQQQRDARVRPVRPPPVNGRGSARALRR